MEDRESSLADDLRAARALIDTPEKWCKESYECDGAMCVLGAGQSANGLQEGGPEYYAALRGALPPEWEPDENDWSGDVPQFNDDPATTHADIMALFDRAIDAAEAKATGAA